MSSSSSKYRSFDPAHGGALNAAAEYFDIPVNQWLDISTGINPTSWSVPEIPTAVWQRLPENQHDSPLGLEQTAVDYYLGDHNSGTTVGRSNILPCGGSQQGIRLLPALYNALNQGHKSKAKVWVTSGSYAEHGIAWEEQGHRVCKVSCDHISDLLTQQPVDVLILVNPDNPSGYRWSAEQLLKWWSILHRRGGWLIVDEAFMDTTPEDSLASHVEREGLFVLRSVGKFFGLAGLRLGFVLSATKMISRLQKMLGPWSVSHPAQYLGQIALQDTNWINQQRQNLLQQSVNLAALLEKSFGCRCEGTELFQTLYHKDAELFFIKLARQAVLVRFLPETSRTPAGLRFGLPANNEASWQHLELALASLKKE